MSGPPAPFITQGGIRPPMQPGSNTMAQGNLYGAPQMPGALPNAAQGMAGAPPGIRPPGAMGGAPMAPPPGPGVRPAFPGQMPPPGMMMPPAGIRPPGPQPGFMPPPGPMPGSMSAGGAPPPLPGAMGFQPGQAPGMRPMGMPPGPGAPLAQGLGAPLMPQGPAMQPPGPMAAAPGAGTLPPAPAYMPPGPGVAPAGPGGMPPGPQGMPPPGPGGMPGPGGSYGPPVPGGMPQFRPPGPMGMPPGPGGMPPGMMPSAHYSAGPGGMTGPGMPHQYPPGPGGMMPPGPPGMMHQPPGPPGMMPPPGPPGMPPGPSRQSFSGAIGAPPHMGAGYDPYAAQRMVEQFESLTLAGLGPGLPEGVDPLQLPRPTGDALEPAMAAQPSFDRGNCSPDNMRLTLNCIPNSTALRARWAMPIGLVVQPMADEAKGREVPVVNLGSAGIVRCRRCRTYMNPFVQWTDSGRRFRCNVCTMLNEVPMEYFCNLDQDGRRTDLAERPELALGTVEYVAPAEYMVRPPMPPVYFFCIDVTYAAVVSGALAAACRAIKDSLDRLPGDERTLIGFLTFDSSLHFYNLKSTLTQPQMMVVTELEEPFVPLPDDLLVNLSECRTMVDMLLDTLPNNFASNTCVESGMGPALQAAFMVMAHVGGKLMLFQSSAPSLGIGKIKNRDNPQAYNTDREAALRNPDDNFYKRFAAECSRVQISVDTFTFSSQYMDLASLAAIPRYTCGEVYHYPGFNAARDEVKLAHEVRHNLSRPTAWEAVMRIRCSKGLRISSFHGHFFNRSTDLLALPTCDPDKAFAVQIAHEENMVATPVSYVQCALLYTNSNGERRIRVHTLSVPVVSELPDLYNGSDAAALACLTAKLAVEKSLVSHLEETRQMVQQKLVALLKEFRMMNASALRQPNKLIYPANLRYLPLWTLGLLRSAAFRGGAKDVNADERMVAMHWVMEASVETLCKLAYPHVYAVHDPSGAWGQRGEDGRVPLPPTSPASLPLLLESGAYLIDNGRMLVLWIGRMVAREWSMEVLGGDLNSMDPAQLSVEPARAAPLSQRLNNVLGALRAGRPLYQQCFVVRQSTPMEVHAMPYLVEDRMPATPSYSDFMMNLHKGVLSK